MMAEVTKIPARIGYVRSPEDYPPEVSVAEQKSINELFARLFPGNARPRIEGDHSGFAIIARNPQMALQIVKLGEYVAREMPWCARRDLRELAVQAVNIHFQCETSFEAHVPHAAAAGISPEVQAAIPLWRTSNVLDDEQRLVVEYAFAVASGEVADPLFARAKEHFGETGTIEFTTAVAWWSFWAMILNATRSPRTL